MRRVLVLSAWLWCVATTSVAQPPISTRVDFDDATVGMGLAKDRYRSAGIILNCTPGHWLYTVERNGPTGHFGRSLAVSPGGSDLYISVEFFLPGTGVPGAVQATDIQALDAANRGYAYEYYDLHGNPANNGSNHGDYRMGEGWYYSDGPVAHRFIFRVGTGIGVYLDNIRCSDIVGGSVAIRGSTWSEVRALYR